VVTHSIAPLPEHEVAGVGQQKRDCTRKLEEGSEAGRNRRQFVRSDGRLQRVVNTGGGKVSHMVVEGLYQMTEKKQRQMKGNELVQDGRSQ
jgi:hypothetical protein